jgi:Ca2+-binding RTX toxin-like protein
VYGGSGNDLIVGDAGNDRLSGGSGYDVFAFGMGSDKDKITDFSVKQDKIDLSELAQFDTFYDVQEAMTSGRHGTTINLGDTDGDGYNDTIELVGVSQKMLKDGNFILYHDDVIT